jgi:hypothetical protein
LSRLTKSSNISIVTSNTYEEVLDMTAADKTPTYLWYDEDSGNTITCVPLEWHEAEIAAKTRELAEAKAQMAKVLVRPLALLLAALSKDRDNWKADAKRMREALEKIIELGAGITDPTAEIEIARAAIDTARAQDMTPKSD